MKALTARAVQVTDQRPLTITTDLALTDLAILAGEVERVTTRWLRDADQRQLSIEDAVHVQQYAGRLRSTLAGLSRVLGNAGGGHSDICACLDCWER